MVAVGVNLPDAVVAVAVAPEHGVVGGSGHLGDGHSSPVGIGGGVHLSTCVLESHIRAGFADAIATDVIDPKARTFGHEGGEAHGGHDADLGIAVEVLAEGRFLIDDLSGVEVLAADIGAQGVHGPGAVAAIGALEGYFVAACDGTDAGEAPARELAGGHLLALVGELDARHRGGVADPDAAGLVGVEAEGTDAFDHGEGVANPALGSYLLDGDPLLGAHHDSLRKGVKAAEQRALSRGHAHGGGAAGGGDGAHCRGSVAGAGEASRRAEDLIDPINSGGTGDVEEAQALHVAHVVDAVEVGAKGTAVGEVDVVGDADVAVAVDVPGGAPQAGGAGACCVVVDEVQETGSTAPGDAFDVVFAEGAAEDRFIALVLVGAAQFPHDVQIARVHNRVCGCFLQLGHAVEALGWRSSRTPFDLDGELEVAIDDVVAAIALDRVGAAAAQQDVAEGQGAGSGRSGEQVGAGQQGVVDQGAIQGHVGAEQAADLGELVLGEAVVEGVDRHSGEGWLQVSAAVTQDEVVKAGARNSFCVGVEGVANDQVGLRVDRGNRTEIDLPGGDIATEDHPVEAIVTGVAVVASAIDEDVVAEFAVTAVIAVPEHDHVVAILLAVASSDGQTGVDIQHQAAAVLTDHSVSTAASLEPVVANAAHGGAAAAATNALELQGIVIT